ncbi:MAG TPA: agmatine deiminase family protein [Bryobacteraceae bacterium]|nr:agmatine deiminase family protein [Bryobacteraceae bacterium]
MKFRMPAEWEPHEGTWIAWPHERTDWPGKFAPIPWIYCDIVRHLSRTEGVHILVNDAEAASKASRMLRSSHCTMDAVDFLECPTDRSWTRDYCPTFVREANSGQVTILDWHFNGWAKYDNWQTDDAVPAKVAEHLNLARCEPTYQGRRIVLEGGSIDVNGAGVMLTTEECLLSPIQARNPGLEKRDLEAIFAEYLGCRRTVWLKDGIAGDDTHGHIDDLARFTDANTIAIAVENDPNQANYEPTQENLAILRSTDFRVVPLPMPEPVYFRGQLLPASYANFYIANQLVLVPTFNDVKDRQALNILADLFPDRQVIGIPCRDLVLGLGTLHCMTQQQIAP